MLTKYGQPTKQAYFAVRSIWTFDGPRVGASQKNDSKGEVGAFLWVALFKKTPIPQAEICSFFFFFARPTYSKRRGDGKRNILLGMPKTN